MNRRSAVALLAVLTGLVLAPAGCRWIGSSREAQVPTETLLARADTAMESKDYAEAMHDYCLAADAGDASAVNCVGWLCENGWGTDKDPAEAMVSYAGRRMTDTRRR